ncbi:Protein N-acetyltransferase, RimJ/RimL family [Marininema mesophilum]|uniref:Protein N-acetyltransferase, RimJ/RimL family n=1 Tax=Marininema mesophilum TaxID=1048340 RepID=A0A1H3C6E2_9BACL|nr:GNAT family N-acetyltransferase [Marininema mesophilum]SDX49737.1 Protein N-acetyltransferase, RimJ/RimL family [Marininema mesophilum]
MEDQAIHQESKQQFTIRKLKPTDAAAYREIRLRSLREHPEAFASDVEDSEAYNEDLSRFADQLQERPGQFLLGAIAQDGLLKGIAGLVQYDKKKLMHKGMLWGMYVAPEIRGHGMGRRLVDSVIEEARQIANLEQIYLCVVSDNHVAKGLYERIGFTTFGREPHAMKLGGQYLDEEHMVLFL